LPYRRLGAAGLAVALARLTIAAMLKYRLIFGPLMIALLLGLFYLDNHLDRVTVAGVNLPPGLIILAIFILLAGLGAREIGAISSAKGVQIHVPTVSGAATATLVLMYLMPLAPDAGTGAAVAASAAGLTLVAALVRHTRGQQTQGAVMAGAATLLAVVYMGMLGGFYLLIRHDHSAWVVAGVILVAKSTDIGAYFTGRAVGRHKLIPWLSPGKTREGFVGGLILTAGSAVTAVWLLELGIPLWAAATAGAIIGAVSQFGDLVASLMKRDAGIKDSGQSIPGFGGVLDVADSALMVAPVAYWLLWLAT
jgi:phosphatidate cytidylyltransferase